MTVKNVDPTYHFNNDNHYDDVNNNNDTNNHYYYINQEISSANISQSSSLHQRYYNSINTITRSTHIRVVIRSNVLNSLRYYHSYPVTYIVLSLYAGSSVKKHTDDFYMTFDNSHMQSCSTILIVIQYLDANVKLLAFILFTITIIII